MVCGKKKKQGELFDKVLILVLAMATPISLESCVCVGRFNGKDSVLLLELMRKLLLMLPTF